MSQVGAGVEGLTRDGRELDTVNRLLMHAARHHTRDAVFLRWERGRGGKGWGWAETPDWRADRNAIRVALVLRQRLEIAEGERVALWLPLGPEWAVIERGTWSVGAVSVPVWPEWTPDAVAEVLMDAHPVVLFAPDWEAVRTVRALGGLPDSTRVIIVMRGEPDRPEEALPFAKFMDYGGVLDTAERAAMWRTSARLHQLEEILSVEYEPDPGGWSKGEFSHREMMGAIRELETLLPVGDGRIHAVALERPQRVHRALVYAGWGDGSSRTAFCASPQAIQRVAALEPQVVAGGTETARAIVANLPASGGSPQGGLGRLAAWAGRFRGDGGHDTPRGVPSITVLIADDGDQPDGGGASIRRVSLSDVDVPLRHVVRLGSGWINRTNGAAPHEAGGAFESLGDNTRRNEDPDPDDGRQSGQTRNTEVF